MAAPSPRQAGPSRVSFISRITAFPSRTISVVPYAPERLSISGEVMGMSPTMAEALRTASIDVPPALKRLSNTLEDIPKHPIAEDLPESPRRANTLFAALRIRRALQHRKASIKAKTSEVVNVAQANAERHHKVLKRYKIRRMVDPEDEAKLLKNLSMLMVNPHSMLYKLWQLMTLIIIIYQSLSLPYTMAFSSSESSWFDTFTNCVFGCDILIQFNTPVSANDEETEYITDRIEIARIYVRGWLFFDVIACFPFDSVLQLFYSNKTGNLGILGLLKALRVPRLLRLVRLLRVLRIIKVKPELRRWLQYSRHANLFRLTRLVLGFFVLTHYTACIWYGGVASDEMKSQDTSTNAFHQYLLSFYMTLLVIMGQNFTLYDDTEYVFCILVAVAGAILMAVVFGNVAMLIANYYESQSSHQKKMEWLFASMNRMQLPLDLQTRITDYYQAMWERHGTLDGAVTAFIPELSRNLAYEVELFLRMDMINRAPIFQNCSAKVVQELVMELELQVFMPGDYVVVRGEVGNDMYFVQSGICEVTKDLMLQRSQTFNPSKPVLDNTNEVVLKTLGQGDYFGEIALLMNCKRTANVRAQVFSELCTLTRETFENISVRYLEDRNIIERFIMDKYDPSMLQAAMKQSHEISHRGSASGSQTPDDPSDVTTAKLLEVLMQVDERLHRLEQRIAKDAQERRESEVQFNQQQTQQKSPSISSGSKEKISMGLQHSKFHAEYVAFEPERVSQRNLFSSARLSINQAAIEAMLDEANGQDGIATPEHSDEKKLWRRPSIHRSGSWRNSRRDGGSSGSVRLRGLVKHHVAETATVRHSSRAPSLNAAINEGIGSLTKQLSSRSNTKNEVVHREEDEIHEHVTADALDDLEMRLAYQEGTSSVSVIHEM